MKMHNPRQLPAPASLRSHYDSLSSSSMSGSEMKHSQEDELPSLVQNPSPYITSPEFRERSSSPCNHHLGMVEYKVYRNNSSSDASTQTEENITGPNESRETCSRGTSTDDRSLEPKSNKYCQNQVQHINENSAVTRNLISPAPSSSSAFLSDGQIDTLESLIRADAYKINRSRILEEEKFRMPSSTKVKATNLLMQLISCGSIPVKGHSFGITHTCRPRFPHSNHPTPFFSTSLIMGEPHRIAHNSKIMARRLEDKEYVSRSLIESNLLKEGANRCTSLDESSSFNANRSCKQLDATADIEGTSACLKPGPISELMRSPVHDGSWIPFGGVDNLGDTVPSPSSGSSRRMAIPLMGMQQPVKPSSIGEEKEGVTKIEERLASGARIIIQSSAPCDSNMS